MQAVSGKGLVPGETGAPLGPMVLSLLVGTQTSKYRHTKPPAQEIDMEFKEKAGWTAVIKAGHGQTSVLTSNFLQVTNSLFILCLPMIFPPCPGFS